MGYKRLGDYIREVNVRNNDLKITNPMGINIEKYFMPSVANVIGTDLSTYKLVNKNQFACNLMHVGRDERIPMALHIDDAPIIVSPAYFVFEIIHNEILLPSYLMIWFRRPEFDRNAWFYTDADVRGGLSKEAFLDMCLPIPSIEEQRKIVAEYQAVEQRIENNNRLIKALEDTAQAIYHHTFVENIDPENLPEGWRMGKLSDIAEYSKERIDTSELDNNSYISTENMLKDKAGVIEADKIPEGRCIKFKVGDILLSNIRPYFKKVWKCTFDGGCSADVLCIRTKVNYPPEYTYQVVENDKFFDYVTAGCKGTKMPRGDKDWNMNYIIPIPSIKSMNYFRINAMRIGNYIELLRNENMLQFKLKNLLLSKLS